MMQPLLATRRLALLACLLLQAGPGRAESSDTSQAPAGEPAAQAVTFEYAPPDGTRAHTTYRLQRTRTAAGMPTVRDESEHVTEAVWRRGAAGYTVTHRTVSMSMKRNGQAVDDPISGVLGRLQPVFEVSPDGELVGVKGFERVADELRARVSPELAAALAPVLGEAALVNRERTEWNGRYAQFAGAQLSIGEVVQHQAEHPLPTGGSLTYAVRTVVRGWEPCAGSTCVRIEQAFESDAETLARWAADLTRPLSSPLPGPAAAAGGSRVTGSLSRLIDPGTMLIHDERLERTITMPMQVPGAGLTTVTQHEVRDYRHRYGPD